MQTTHKIELALVKYIPLKNWLKNWEQKTGNSPFVCEFDLNGFLSGKLKLFLSLNEKNVNEMKYQHFKCN